MKIEQIRSERCNGRPRIAARVLWEDTDRPPQEIYFETDEEFGEALACRADPFAAAALSPALWAGERRIHVEGEICPELLANMTAAAQFFQHWFGLRKNGAAVEATPRAKAAEGLPERRAAFFFSGGLDSLATLRANRVSFPRSHPGWFRDGIVVYGLEVESEEPFRHVMELLKELAEEAEVTPLPVSTNIRVLNPDWVFWWTGYMGPALCAIAHALGRRISSAVIASDYDVPHLKPHGSHPLIEPNFSSHELRIRYDGITLSRLEKAKLVAGWPPALQRLRVCNKTQQYERGRLNCGECEKCIRTMLELEVAGALGRAAAFSNARLTAELVETKGYVSPAIQLYYDELIVPLREMGRNDLATAIERLIASARARAESERGWKARLRKFDQERLNGVLLSLKRAILPQRAGNSNGAGRKL